MVLLFERFKLNRVTKVNFKFLLCKCIILITLGKHFYIPMIVGNAEVSFSKKGMSKMVVK